MSTIPAKAQLERKVRRQKQFVAVGSLVLLALLGFELPKLLGGGSDTAAPVVTPTPSLSSPLASATGQLPDTDRPIVQRDAGQLLSFGLFKSKDPFVQQISTSPLSGGTPIPAPAAVPAVTTTPQPQPSPAAPSATPPATTTLPGATVPFPSTTPVIPASPTTTPAPAAPTPTTPTSPASTTPVVTVPAATTPAAPSAGPTSVLLSTNGFCETVVLNGTFPSNEDIFRVVWIAKDGKSVRIAVVGGAYDSGQATATLKMGEKLTLVNTADGTRYVIALKTKCDVQTAPAATTATSPPPPTTTTATAAVPTTPTTTVTTPIVTDSLDTTVPSG